MTELQSDPLKLRVVMGSTERRGAWKVPPRVEAHVMWGNMELDLREAELGPDTTIDAHVTMGNLEIIVPPELAVELDVHAVGGHVGDARRAAPPGDPAGSRVRIVGRVKLGNCEVFALRPDEPRG